MADVPGASPAVINGSVEPPAPLPSVADTVRDLMDSGRLDPQSDGDETDAYDGWTPEEDGDLPDEHATDTPVRTELRTNLLDHDVNAQIAEWEAADEEIAYEGDLDGEPEDDEESYYEPDEGPFDDEEHWSAEQLAVLDSLDDHDRSILTDWAREIQRGAQRKFDHAARMRMEYERIGEVLRPIQAEIEQAQIAPAEALRQIVGLYSTLQRNPLGVAEWIASQLSARGTAKGTPQARETIARMARALGVDGDWDGGDPFSEPDETTRREIHSLKQQIAYLQGAGERQAAEASERQMRSQVRGELEEFAARGLPYFEDEGIQATMARLIQGGLASGLDDAYRQALRLEGLESRRQVVNGERARRAATPRTRGGGGRQHEPDPIDAIDLGDQRRTTQAKIRAELARQILGAEARR